jgi:hypothetical protein
MGLLISQILDTENDFHKLCPGMFRAYASAKRKATPIPDLGGATILPESTDYNHYLTEQQKLAAKYMAVVLSTLPNMPKNGTNGTLGMFTEQYNEGVLTDWEYIERVVEVGDKCLASANSLLYANVKQG